MSDTAHASLMDGVYRRQRHIYDLTRKYYLLGRDQLIEGLLPPPGGTVLEVGCGTGRNLIAAARRYPNSRFYGIDISQEMLTTARANIARAGLADRIIIARADATSFVADELFDHNKFDRIFISYALSMIPGWQGTIEHALTQTTDKGSLHIVDFGFLEKLPKQFKAILHGWLAKFHVTPRADLDNFLTEIARRAGGQVFLENLYRHYAVHAIIKKTDAI